MESTPLNLPPKNVCFEGGGIRGLAYAGVAKALEEKNIKFQRFIGSSAGSIFAGLLACYATSEFLEETVKTTDFSYFMDGWGWSLGKAYRFTMKMGLYLGDYFMDWYSGLLHSLTGNPDITLNEIYTMFGTELIVTSTNISKRKVVYFTKDSHPDLPVKVAVRMSMSLPYYYVPYYFEGDYWTDGGYLDDYPIDYLDQNYPGEANIGFVLCGNSTPEKISGWDSLITNMTEASVLTIEELREQPGDSERTVGIDTFNIKTTDFGIDEKDIERLIKSGYTSTIKFFS